MSRQQLMLPDENWTRKEMDHDCGCMVDKMKEGMLVLGIVQDA